MDRKLRQSEVELCRHTADRVGWWLIGLACLGLLASVFLR